VTDTYWLLLTDCGHEFFVSRKAAVARAMTIARRGDPIPAMFELVDAKLLARERRRANQLRRAVLAWIARHKYLDLLDISATDEQYSVVRLMKARARDRSHDDA
jgi:hypothetical protein